MKTGQASNRCVNNHTSLLHGVKIRLDEQWRTMMSNQEFETSDIVLAAYLKTKNYRLIEIVKNGNKGTFIFAGVEEVIIDEYDLGQALVEPKSLNYEIKALTTAARR